MTRTVPLRLTILHLTQIFLTDALTFMLNPFKVPGPELCPASSQLRQEVRAMVGNRYGMFKMC